MNHFVDEVLKTCDAAHYGDRRVTNCREYQPGDHVIRVKRYLQSRRYLSLELVLVQELGSNLFLFQRVYHLHHSTARLHRHYPPAKVIPPQSRTGSEL